jgi:1-aminocyclopropane-1-carboxylate deaminase/D-cysteine desulfhydrase-like pyridoxal-dependent ACC family enzyme
MTTDLQSVPTAILPSSSLEQARTIPLFMLYPRLRQRLPYVSLGTFPTPVHRLQKIGTMLGLDNLYLKRDDQTGTIYGGNKVRKLEFLLGDVLQTNAKEIMTVGFAGSNHALATAIYAKQVGLTSLSLLMPQANAYYVRRNLLASHHYGARLRCYKSLWHLCLGIIGQHVRGVMANRTFTRFIPAGGSCPLGVIGYVNATLELKDQISAGLLPEPDFVYVPLGSMGTSAGLTLGLKAAGLRTQVLPVRVIEQHVSSLKKLLCLIRETEALLSKSDSTFPCIEITKNDLSIRNDFLGEGYARFTDEGMAAAALMKTEAGIVLNGTYSAKAFSALVHDARKELLTGKTVLFWNTYNSRDLSTIAKGVDYHQLPRAFHRYFTDEIQSLDLGYDR